MKFKLLVLVYSCCYVILTLFSETFASSTSDKDTKMDEYIDSRNALLREMVRLQRPLEESANINDINQTKHLAIRLKSAWSQILNVSSLIFDSFNRFNHYKEERYQWRLKQYASYLFFIAKFRRCASPDETFYKPINKCLPIDSTEHCPENMILNDGPDNEGFCDCSFYPPDAWILRDVLDPRLLFFAQTGLCYLQNSQGPCQEGEWIILKDGTPECQPVPEGCPADGHHVYWSPNEKLEKQCWKMWTQGPCPLQQIVRGGGGLDVFCGEIIQMTTSSVHVAPLRNKKIKCHPGSLRNQNHQCTNPSFF